ncbi:hypothetical protein JCM10207_000737 [Rhodosporidiobolus poonsookiae]
MVSPPLSPPLEPDSPVMYEEDEPELDGLRHLSVSTDGTIDSLISQDENPTPPHSPTAAPIVHVSPPGASFPLAGPRVLDFGEEDHPMMGHFHDQAKGLASGPPTPTTGLATPIAAPSTAFFGAVTPVTPPDFRPEIPRGGNLAARRAASGSLPNKALISLQQMRFESSREAGMGLGVGPPSSGLDVSPGGPGLTFRLAMGLDGDEKDGASSPARSPGVENIAIDSPSALGPPAAFRWSSQQAGNKMPRSPGEMPSFSGEAFKPSLRNTNLRLNLGGATFSPASSPLPSPSGERPPNSPLTRSSAFHFANTGPRTPLTPSHLPGAPSLGGGNASFSWFSYSMPDSPGCPVPPEGVHVAERSCYFSDVGLASPSSSNGTYLPTPGSERSRTPFGAHRTIPASPLGQGAFASSAANPFFA